MAGKWIVAVIAWSAAAAAEPAPSTAAVTQVAIVTGTTCALHADGAVSCWGRELDHSRDDPAIHSRPVRVPAFGDGIVQLEGVFFGICGRYRDGSVKCLGMTPASRDALETQPLRDVVDLRGTCARSSDGHVACFDSKTWTRVPGIDDAVYAHGGDLTGCAVHKDTTVSCWSLRPGTKPELIGAGPDGAVQVIAGVKDAVQVSAGLFFGCARLRDGRVTCWGDNNAGELGRGALDESAYSFHAAAVVPGVTDAVDLMAGAVHACIRRKSGAMACWGDFPWSDKKYPRVTEVKPLAHVTAFAGGDQHCAVGKGREIWCMGIDRSGELGNGLSGIQDVALAIPGIRDAIQIYATTLGTCVLRKTGTVTCFGEHNNFPIKLPAVRHLSQSVRMFSGEYLTGLDAQGRLWVHGEATPRKLPKGTAHAGVCVIANGGEVWCNAIPMGGRGPANGRLDGVTDAVEIVGSQRMVIRHRSGAVSTFSVDDALQGRAPAAVPAIDDAISLASGSRIDCAVRANHSVWCWGDAESPLLGHAPAKPTYSRAQLPPAPIAGITDAVSVAIADPMASQSIGFMCAVKLDGSVACWGENRSGQLGNRTKVASTTPITIAGVKDAVAVAGGWLHACALEKSGEVVCWGSTEQGAGGTPPTDRVDHPVAVVWP